MRDILIGGCLALSFLFMCADAPLPIPSLDQIKAFFDALYVSQGQLGGMTHFARSPVGSPVTVSLGALAIGSQQIQVPIAGLLGSGAPSMNDQCLVTPASGQSLPAGVSITGCNVFNTSTLAVIVSSTIALTALSSGTIKLNFFVMG